MILRKQRQVALIVYALIIALLLSTVYMALEAGHHCEDDHCPICEQMALCRQIFRLSFSSLLLLMVREGAFFVACYRVRVFPEKVTCTLITQKVKLSA